MQRRMKEFSMSQEDMDTFLEKVPVGHISTVNADGCPYTVAVHFIYAGGKIYFHGLSRGQKLDNISRCPKVCFEADEMTGLLFDPSGPPCKTNTQYQSVVITGTAVILADPIEKRHILHALAAKYTPECRDAQIPEDAAARTAVVEISVGGMTGKYYK